MHRVRVRVQEADRDRLDPLVEQAPDRAFGVRRSKRPLHPAGGVEPFVDGDPQVTRHEHRRLLPGHVVEPWHAQRADLQDVAEALGRDQAGPGPLTLENGIRGYGRAVTDLRDLGRSEPAGPQNLAEAGHDRARIVVDRGRDLLGVQRAVGAQYDDIGEGAADIDADPNAAHELRPAAAYGTAHARPSARSRPARGAVRGPERAGRRLIDGPGCAVDRNPVRLPGELLRDQLVADVREHPFRVALQRVAPAAAAGQLVPEHVASPDGQGDLARQRLRLALRIEDVDRGRPRLAAVEAVWPMRLPVGPHLQDRFVREQR